MSENQFDIRLQRLDLAPEASSPIHILLIEDNEEDALLIRQLLGLTRRFFFRLSHASNLAQAMDFLMRQRELRDSQAPPHVILTDLNLPDSCGYDTFRQILVHAPTVPIVLLTNMDDESLALQAIREGAQDYILKTELSGQLLSRALRYAIERIHGEQALRESRERYMLAMQGANDGLWDWNLRTNQIYFSSRWKAMLGYSEVEIADHPEEWLKRIHHEDFAQVRIALAAHIQGHSQHFECEYRILHKDGQYRWALARGLAVKNGNGKASRMAGSQTDITARKRSEQQLAFDAFHDTLTGLTNRALFLDRLGRAIEHRKRRVDYRFAVLFLDLDRFKVINDSLGHSIGDQLLVACARKLERCLRSADTVSRFGGDEFVILLDDIKRKEDAMEVAERIQSEFQKPIALQGGSLTQHQVVISASIGIVFSEPAYERCDDLLRDADIAMYHAKMMGKACQVLFEAPMRQRVINRLELENDLRKAMEDQQLQVHYQPIVSLDTWRMTGFEALVRWKHPLRGFIPPKEFIPVAEETGLIHSLGLWVLEQACEQMRRWQNDFPLDPPLVIHVNVSGVQFGQPDFVDNVKQVLDQTSLDPHYLCLEITESLFMENDGRFNDTLSRLCSLGIQLQIDDFGTGYSSFAYLQRIPVSSIKIDSMFISKLESGNNHTEIVRSIIALARNLGMSAIAEGVESEGQLQRLRELDCSYGQGYFISRPVPSKVGNTFLMESQGTGRLNIRI